MVNFWAQWNGFFYRQTIANDCFSIVTVYLVYLLTIVDQSDEPLVPMVLQRFLVQQPLMPMVLKFSNQRHDGFSMGSNGS